MEKIRIKDMPKTDRPRERLFKLGGESLSTPELLAIILRTGSMGESAVVITAYTPDPTRWIEYRKRK